MVYLERDTKLYHLRADGILLKPAGKTHMYAGQTKIKAVIVWSRKELVIQGIQWAPTVCVCNVPVLGKFVEAWLEVKGSVKDAGS